MRHTHAYNQNKSIQECLKRGSGEIVFVQHTNPQGWQRVIELDLEKSILPCLEAVEGYWGKPAGSWEKLTGGMDKTLAKPDSLGRCEKETNLESRKMMETQWKQEQKKLDDQALDEMSKKRSRSKADSMLGLRARERKENQEWKSKLTKMTKVAWKLHCKIPRDITKTAIESKSGNFWTTVF